MALKQTATTCVPPLAAPLTRLEAEELAATVKALADPTRLQLLSLLRAEADGEAAACHFVEIVGLSQPTVSHHLKVLHEAGLLERERRGSCVYYRLPPDRIASICRALL
jgi:ArsR family transcriptional regulator